MSGMAGRATEVGVFRAAVTSAALTGATVLLPPDRRHREMASAPVLAGWRRTVSVAVVVVGLGGVAGVFQAG